MLRFSSGLSIFWLCAAAAPTFAQTLPTPPARRPVIEKACARDLQHFCPDLVDTGQLRNQLICLRPYRLDLERPCHRAVDAASR